MQIRLRIMELLEERQIQQHGLIKRICDYTKLERHKVSTLVQNRAKRISLHDLAAICDYLIDRHQVDPRHLPGLLLGLEGGEFWSLLAARRYIEITFGMRRDPERTERQWVMASDSYLHGVLLHEIFGPGPGRFGHQTRFLEQRLMSAITPDMRKKDVTPLQNEAREIYKNFRAHRGDKALVCVGSVKSNPLIELVVANIFKTEPFVSQDNHKEAKTRNCPIYLRYRKEDPKLSSCHGGVQLSKKKQKYEPGIYYKTLSDGWSHCPWNATEDVAMVLYAFYPASGRLEMAIGGFSGRATRCLAAQLHTIGDSLWPPTYTEGDMELGVFLVSFEFKDSEDDREGDKSSNFFPTPSSTKVIPIDRKVLESLSGIRPSHSKKSSP